jgi:hypothetical protein
LEKEEDDVGLLDESPPPAGDKTPSRNQRGKPDDEKE